MSEVVSQLGDFVAGAAVVLGWWFASLSVANRRPSAVLQQPIQKASSASAAQVMSRAFTTLSQAPILGSS